MKTAIVTGANGFIGRWLIKELAENNVEVTAVVRPDSNIEEIKKISNVKIVYCDMNSIFNLPASLDTHNIDVFYHLAWAGSTGNARADYELQLKNIKNSSDAVCVSKIIGAKRFIGAGTLAEYDVQNYTPTDGATPNTVSNYGTAKIATHFISKAECVKNDIEHIWAYLPNTYGEGNYTNNFVNFATKKFLRDERASFTDGKQYYDFVYVTDVAKALRLLGEKGKKFHSYYIGSNKPDNLYKYIEIMRDEVDPSIPLFLGEVPFNGVSQPIETFSCDKIIRDTGYLPEVSFFEGIKKTVKWLKEGENL